MKLFHKNVSIIVAISIVFGGGGYWYLINSKNNSAYQTVTQDQPQKKLVSRQLMEVLQEFVRKEKPTPTESARLYAYVTKVYSDVYEISLDSSKALFASRMIFETLYPAKSENYIAEIKKLDANQNIILSAPELELVNNLEERIKTDGFLEKWDGNIPTGEGKWKKPGALDPFAPESGKWKRWIVESDFNFQIPEPFKSNSPEYEAQKNEVIKATKSRTPDDLQAINYWGGGPGSEGPSGIWQNQLYELTKDQNLTEKDYAKIQSVLAQGLADSFMEAWKIKYTFWTERPSMTIKDLNLAMPDPNFPGYVSGHSTISKTAAEILGNYFPEKKETFLERAQTAKNSRLNAGVHFPMDNEQGFMLGEKVGKQVLAKLGRISNEEAAGLEKFGSGKMTVIETDKSHDQTDPERSKNKGFLYRVSDSNPQPIKPMLLASAGGENLNGKDGFGFELIGNDAFWFPGACASLPSYKVDKNTLLTLVGKAKMGDNTDSEKFVLYNYETKKFTYLFDESTQLMIGLVGLNRDEMEYVYSPQSAIKKVNAEGGPKSFFESINTDIVVKRKINLNDKSFQDYKIPLPKEIAGRDITIQGWFQDGKSSIYTNPVEIKKSDGGSYSLVENAEEKGDLYWEFVDNNFKKSQLSVKQNTSQDLFEKYEVNPNYETSEVVIRKKDNTFTTKIQLKKGLESAYLKSENDTYLELVVGATQAGSANSLFINKQTKEVRVLMNQEYNINESTGGFEAKTIIFSLGNIEP